MNEKNLTLTPADRLILESYKAVIDGLADYLGAGYEFVLHSLEDLEHSVVKIINGHHTGRREGAPITDMALAMLAHINGDTSQRPFVTYAAKNKFGKPLKASTIVIRGERNRVIALLCINFYLDTPISEIINCWSVKEDSKLSAANESFVENPQELLGKLIQDAITQIEADPSITAANQKKAIVERLDESGVFKLKGSVHFVARELGISKNTVYLHLRNLKQDD